MRNSMVLCGAVLFGSAAMAGELPKEGKFTAVFHGVGTYKAITMGKDITFSAWDETGYTVSDGLFDHLTWRCLGIYDAASGMAKYSGHCVTTDLAGDQIASDVVSEGTAAVDAKTTRGKGVFTGGTGKYAGISGGWTFVTHGGEYKVSADNTFVELGSNEGSYKLHQLRTKKSAPTAKGVAPQADQRVDPLELHERNLIGVRSANMKVSRAGYTSVAHTDFKVAAELTYSTSATYEAIK